jgi:hypothetical protein
MKKFKIFVKPVPESYDTAVNDYIDDLTNEVNTWVTDNNISVEDIRLYTHGNSYVLLIIYLV